MASAAARVFGIAELLENILIQVAHIEVMHSTELGGHIVALPKAATQLYQLQRVDRNFNLNIKHSKKLARLMFLAGDGPRAGDLPLTSIYETPEKLYGKFAPMVWLLNDLWQTTDALDAVIVDFQDEDTKADHFEGGHETYDEFSKSHYITTRQDSGASWRHMKVSTATGAGKATASFRVWTSQGWGSDEEAVEHEHTEWYRLEGSETLGDFFDRFVVARKELHKIVGL